MSVLARTLAAIALSAAPVAAERSWHGSAGAGSSLVLTGARGDRFRFEVSADIKPHSRYGIHLTWQAFDADHRGLVMAGLVYEGAAARPRLVLDLHANAGADLDARAPVVGGGVRATLSVVGPLGLGFETGGYFVIDGVDDSRLQLQASTLIVGRW